ncbi:tyrosine transporter, partial [Vibrio xuii]
GGGLGLNSIARKTLGKGGQLVSNALLYALLICLLMAYILGAADLVNQLAQKFGVDLTNYQSQIGFTLLSGILIAAGTGVRDKLNRALFFIMIASLSATLLFLLPDFSSNNLARVINDDHFA